MGLGFGETLRSTTNRAFKDYTTSLVCSTAIAGGLFLCPRNLEESMHPCMQQPTVVSRHGAPICTDHSKWNQDSSPRRSTSHLFCKAHRGKAHVCAGEVAESATAPPLIHLSSSTNSMGPGVDIKAFTE